MSSVKNTILDIMSHLGVGEQVISLYDSIVGIKNFSVDSRIVNFNLSERDRKGYVYIPLIPGYASWSYLASIIGSSCYIRGYEPIIVTCSEVIEPCPAQTTTNAKGSVRDRCQYFSREIPGKFGLETHNIDEFLPATHDVLNAEEIDLETFDYRGINITQPARASCRKYLKRYSIDLNDDDTYRKYREIIRSGVKIADASEKILNKYNISGVLVYEPLYIQGYIPLSLAQDRGIPGRTVGTGYRDSHLLFGNINNKQPHQHFPDAEAICDFLQYPLSEPQRQQISNIMQNRETGAGVTHHFTATSSKSIDSTDTKVMAGMFTNLVWDASLEADNGPYANYFDWVSSTIDYLSGRDGIELIIKVHPAEAARGTNQSVEQWISFNYPELPQNITLLSSDTNVNTYELIRELDVGIVYNSTVGLEMAFRGYPVLIGGDTHYRNLGFTYDPETQSEYLNYLSSLDDLSITSEMLKRAERYAYHLFVRKHIPFPYISSKSNTVDYAFGSVQFSDIAPGVEPFDTIVSGIINNTEIVSKC